MRIWDIHPGYLNRQSLLGEHCELHGLVSIIENHKIGYSHHPETVRWVKFGWALKIRHSFLSAEMKLRGFTDKSPVFIDQNIDQWPTKYIDEPYSQFKILETKYVTKEQGRIPLPKSAQQLWSHHKYSVLARDPNMYKSIGKEVSSMSANQDFSALAKLLSEQLRVCPSQGGIVNSLQHMWGHVSDFSPVDRDDFKTGSPRTLLKEIQQRSLEHKEPYLIQSTALSDLEVWL